MKISLIIPSRNNLKYLKWAYASIRANQGDYDVEVCVADDASTDGTWEWCSERVRDDVNFKAIANLTGQRVGHTVLYDKLIREVATGEVVGIYHADMYLCPGSISKIIETMQPGTVVSLTRIEPPLHPAGPEKVIVDFATEPELFDEEGFLNWWESFYKVKMKDKITEGIFAPWFIHKSDFIASGGHDKLFAPQSKEDSDIFNRFHSLGYKFIQIWEGAVYHMTCRGSRYNPTLTTPGKNSSEWETQNKKSERNFIRKWGTVPLHDLYMKPIVPKKYDITVKLTNATLPLVNAIEPWVSTLVIDNYDYIVPEYISQEQPNTLFNLEAKFKHIKFSPDETHSAIMILDGNTITREEVLLLQQLPPALKAIVDQAGGILPASFSAGTALIVINKLEELACDYTFN